MPHPTNTTAAHTGAPLWLIALCVSRFGASLAFMVHAGALPATLRAWGMSGGEAGAIQTAFNFGYALSLVVSSWCADSLGAKRVFLWSSWASAAAGLAFALFARSPDSALWLFGLLGLTQGGTYAPSIMLVAQGVAANRRGAAVGWLLAAGSLGYFASIALAAALSDAIGYEAAFVACGLGPLLAALVVGPGLRHRPNRVIGARGLRLRDAFAFLADRRSILLTAGYTAHAWELLGMWAWLPAFLTATLATAVTNTSGTGSGGAVASGLWIAGAIHLSGALSSLTMGRASDRLGRRAVLVAMGAMGTVCSVTIGWMGALPVWLILPVAALYGFAALGDSPVLSTAMTEATPPDRLGAALAVRSILGFGAGGVAPLAVGLVLDHVPPGSGGAGWGWGFALLGVGGGMATLCAALLSSDRPASSSVSRPHHRS
ncbi:MFS transporter [Azospirillum griseum]|uniref:MFS transporter n=1 Tax=Azospirillum griseum TaxID=2496639 RepID=UPI001FEAC552|nr:MFS transporter [Azospirillum griseum]